MLQIDSGIVLEVFQVQIIDYHLDFKNFLCCLFFQESKRTTALILLNVMTLLMASNGVVIKNIGDLVDPFTFSALRFTVSSLAFAPFLLILRPGGLEKTAVQAGVEIGFWSTLGYLFQVSAFGSMGLSVDITSSPSKRVT